MAKIKKGKSVESQLGYQPIFDPSNAKGDAGNTLSQISPFCTVHKGLPYVYHEPEIALAVNVALATNRPLLLSGRPGSGKSSLARDVASKLGWEYQEDTITSRTMAEHLQWKFDALQRLSDASNPQIGAKDEVHYVEPGVLWWMFDPESAFKASRHSKENHSTGGLKDINGIVVLLDEIDKAEPDVPNDLLVPLSTRKFTPRGHTSPVESKKEYLLCITTNGERDLPQAFVRRCVTLSLTRPKDEELKDIAVAHNEHLKKTDPLLDQVLKAFNVLEAEMLRERRRPPSTAEFLDAVKACLQLKPKDRIEMSSFTMRKVVEIRD